MSQPTNKYVVFSFDRSQLRVGIDCAAGKTPDAALAAIGDIRKASDVILALQPSQLREYADQLERLSLVEIERAQQAALTEELEHRNQTRIH